jgi:hypothetical protein
MRSAVFRPTPGLREIAFADRGDKFLEAHAGENFQRQRRAHAGSGNQQLEAAFLAGGKETVQRELVFAHVRVDQQRRFAVERAEARECRERDLHLIAHAAHVEQDLIRALLNQLAAERTNHVQRLLISVCGLSTHGQRRAAASGNAAPRHARRIWHIGGEISWNKSMPQPVLGVIEGARLAAGYVCACAQKHARNKVSENSEEGRFSRPSSGRALFACEKTVFAGDANFAFVCARTFFRSLFLNLLSPLNASRLTKRKGRLTSRRKSKCHNVE